MSNQTALSPRQPTDCVTQAIFFAVVLGSVGIMSLLMFMNYISPLAMTAFAVVLAFTGSWVPPIIQKVRNRMSRRT